MWRAGLILFFCPGLGAQQASFEGVATNSVTRQPMSGVHVRLIGFNMDSPGDVYAAISDRAGRFSIGGMKPGAYALMPEFRGFVYLQPKQGAMPIPSVTLKAGEHIADFKLEMTPRAAIAGRVVDEFGDPLQYVSAQAVALSPDRAVGPATLSGQFGATTDDRGMFRISGAPGKYYVKATPNGVNSNGPPEIRTDGTAPAEYAATWYPSAAGKDAATVVEAPIGGEVNIEIRMAPTSLQRSLTLNGVVRGIPEGNARPSVMLQSGDSPGRFTRSRSAPVGADGRFTFSRLEPGFYRVSAICAAGVTRLQSAAVELKLDGDASNVELHLTGAGELTGTLEIAGDPKGPAAPAEKRSVRLEAEGSLGFGSALSGDVDRDGAFHIAAVPQGRFTVHVDPLPENAYVKSLELDGTPVADGVLDLERSAPGGRIKIVVSRKGGQISGSVLDKDGAKLSNAIAMVLLVDDPAKVELDKDDEHMDRVTPDGMYSFKGVRPGKYRMLAIDALHSPDVQQPDTLKKLAAATEEFEVKEGDRIAKDIKVVAQEDTHAKPKP